MTRLLWWLYGCPIELNKMACFVCGRGEQRGGGKGERNSSLFLWQYSPSYQATGQLDSLGWMTWPSTVSCGRISDRAGAKTCLTNLLETDWRANAFCDNHQAWQAQLCRASSGSAEDGNKVRHQGGEETKTDNETGEKKDLLKLMYRFSGSYTVMTKGVTS